MMRASTERIATDMRVISARCAFTRERLRVPLHLSSGSITELTLAHAVVEVEGVDRRRAAGQGMCYLSDQWAWPSAVMAHPRRDAAMRACCERLTALLPQMMADGWGHPVEMGMLLHQALPGIAAETPGVESMPSLAAGVCASSFDAALHDAHGLLHGRSSYDLLGPQALPGDLSCFLGAAGLGITLEQALHLRFTPGVPGCVLISMADPLRAAEVTAPVGDGLPECAEEWIRRCGFAGAKLKTVANDPRTDAAWVSDAARLPRDIHAELGTGKSTWISVDPNEGYAQVEQVVAFLRYLREMDPETYASLRYIEQPIPRASVELDLRPVHALKPVLADESITGVEQLDALTRAGWSGLALKTCKSHTLCLLLAAWSHLAGRPYSLQDLSNPSLAALHALGLAARLHSLNGIELNSPQFTPSANVAAATAHPGAFAARRGEHDASTLTGAGLGYGICASILMPG